MIARMQVINIALDVHVQGTYPVSYSYWFIFLDNM